jgi:hypothetical protein
MYYTLSLSPNHQTPYSESKSQPRTQMQTNDPEHSSLVGGDWVRDAMYNYLGLGCYFFLFLFPVVPVSHAVRLRDSVAR